MTTRVRRNPWRPALTAERPLSFSTSLKLSRAVCHAGAQPNSTPARSVAAMLKKRTGRFTRMSASEGRVNGGMRETITFSSPQARLTPKIPPISDSEAFGQELSEELSPCGAQRGPYGNLFLANGAPRKKKIGHVDASDQQNEAHSAHQQPDILDQVFADEVVLEGFDGGAPALVGLWIDFSNVARDGIHVGVGLLQSDARFEPAHYQDEMKVVVDLLWFESQRDKELRFEAVRLPGCKDSHDRVRLAVQADGLADDFVVTAETLHPKSVSHHHDAIPAHDSFLGENVPPQEKGSAHHVVEAGSGQAGLDHFGMVGGGQTVIAAGPCAEILEDSALLLPIQKVAG